VQIKPGIPLTLVLACLANPLAAQQIGGMKPPAFAEAWGEIIYCREVYKHPDNQSRVYEYDTAQCNAANEHFHGLANSHGEAVVVQLGNAAQQRAQVIKANTRDVGAVLTACRETCSKWAEDEKQE
jgi:hypothetical protein